MMDKLSPNEYQGLPKEVSKFLTHYGVPGELTKIVQIRSIVEEPFTKLDILHELDSFNDVGIFYGLRHDSKTVIYKKEDNKIIGRAPSAYLSDIYPTTYPTYLVHRTLGFKYENGKAAYVEYRANDIKKDILVENLMGRYDLSVVNPSKESMTLKEDYVGADFDADVVYEDDIEYEKADVVLLDLNSVNWIFYKRFARNGFKDPMQLAVRYTLEFFDNIVKSMSNPLDLPSLLNYMILNVYTYGYEPDLSDIAKYINKKEKIVNDEYINNIDEYCSKLYSQIVNYIKDV